MQAGWLGTEQKPGRSSRGLQAAAGKGASACDRRAAARRRTSLLACLGSSQAPQSPCLCASMPFQGGGPVRTMNLLAWGVDLVEEQLLASAGGCLIGTVFC